MADYSAKIQLVVQGHDRLKNVVDTVDKLNSIISRLKPINILAAGGGKGGDVIRQTKKQLDDFSRAIVNFKPEGINKRAKELSNTVAGAAAQADALAMALDNVGLKAGGFSKQVAEVKNYALALEQTRRNAERLATLSEQVQRGARIQTIAERFNVSPQKVEERLNNLRRIRYERDRKAAADRYMELKREEDFELRLNRIRERNAAAEAARSRRAEKIQNVGLGVGFPLLFGGGAGAILGGGLGGLLSGPGSFAAQIGFSAIGQQIDQASEFTRQFAESLREGGDAAGFLEQALGRLNPESKIYIQNLQQSGQTTKAANAAIDELSRSIGRENAEALRRAGEEAQTYNDILNRLRLQFLALSQRADEFFGKTRRDPLGTGQPFIQKSLENIFPAPAVTAQEETQAARDKTAELRLQVDLLVAQTNASKITKQENLAEYKILQEQVIQQEYKIENERIYTAAVRGSIDAQQQALLVQKNQLTRQIALNRLDRQRNNTTSKKVRDPRSSELGLQAQFFQEGLRGGDLELRLLEASQGASAARQRELEQLEARRYYGIKILALERDRQLLAEDLSAIEQEQIQNIYTQKVANLVTQLDIQQKILTQTEAEAKLQKYITDQEALRQATQPFENLKRDRELEIQYNKTYLRLVTEGVLPAEAERIANFERLVAEQLNALDKQIAITQAALIQAEAYGVSADKIKELRDELERLDEARGAVVDEAAKGPEKGTQPGEKIEAAIAAARGELNKLVDMENQVIAGAAAIGDAFQQAFKGLVSGAMTGQEALAAFFKSVGDHFLDMASKMIAKLIEIFILETVLGFISGAASGAASGGSFTSKSNAAGAAAFGGNFKGTGSSTFGSGGIRIPGLPGFAEGGFVTRPTNALIGEGGESEYVLPSSKMRTAMARYSAGARGPGVIPGNSTEPVAAGGAATMEPIDVRYSVERINNVDYVTADQFQRGMAQAAEQGAKRGEQRTLYSLRQNTNIRRSIGV